MRSHKPYPVARERAYEREAGIGRKLRDTVARCLELRAAGEAEAAEFDWANTRREAQRLGLGVESEHDDQNPFPTPWGEASHSVFVITGVYRAWTQQGKVWRLSLSAAHKLLSEEALALSDLRGSGYIWWSERAGLALLKEHPEWGLLAGMTCDATAEGIRHAPKPKPVVEDPLVDFDISWATQDAFGVTRRTGVMRIQAKYWRAAQRNFPKVFKLEPGEASVKIVKVLTLGAKASTARSADPTPEQLLSGEALDLWRTMKNMGRNDLADDIYREALAESRR